MKRFADWKGNLNEFLTPGDQVDEGFVDYFIEVLPPAAMRPDLVQMGEPYDLVDGQYTFFTIAKDGDFWKYAGLCYRGERENRIIFKRQAIQ